MLVCIWNRTCGGGKSAQQPTQSAKENHDFFVHSEKRACSLLLLGLQFIVQPSDWDLASLQLGRRGADDANREGGKWSAAGRSPDASFAGGGRDWEADRRLTMWNGRDSAVASLFPPLQSPWKAPSNSITLQALCSL